MSQRQLAKALGLRSGHISEMERGLRNCAPDLQRRIAKELDCSVEMLARRTAGFDPPLIRSA